MSNFINSKIMSYKNQLYVLVPNFFSLATRFASSYSAKNAINVQRRQICFKELEKNIKA